MGDFGLLGLECMDGSRKRESVQGEIRGVVWLLLVLLAHAFILFLEAGLPRLIPVGEWMGTDVCEHLLDYTSYKLTDKALREKQKGNAAFAGGDFGRALQVRFVVLCIWFVFSLLLFSDVKITSSTHVPSN